MRRALYIFIFAAFVFGSWAFASWYAWSRADAVVPESTTPFRIQSGESFLEAYRNLARADVIEPSWRWLVLISIERPRCLQAGIHDIAADHTPKQLITKLCEPGLENVSTVRLQEGWTRWHIADHLAGDGLVQRDRFVDLTGLPIHLHGTGFVAATAEGFLFPDTYEFSPSANEAHIVTRLLGRFEEVWLSILREHSGKLGDVTAAYDLSPYEVVVVASIVEREAVLHSERTRIAQVIYNRLERDMALQMDPTCIYGPDRYDEKPSPSWCRSDANLWSTYAHNGLPPGPISNPSRASLEAALTPSGEERLLYFVAKNDGSGAHAFSETFDEHRRNISRYLRGGE